MRRRARLTAATAFLALAAFLAGPLSAPVAAFADDYPTWSDVVDARNSEAAAKAEIARIQGLLGQLQTNVQTAQDDLAAKSAAYYDTEARYEAKQTETANLKAQSDAAAKTAADSQRKAGEWAAQVVKVNGTDPTLNLFVQSGDAAAILSAIGITSRLSAQADDLAAQATQQQNIATSLAAQAADAEAQLEVLAKQADDAMAAAQAASEVAQQALANQQTHQAQLEAQLDVLTKNREATEVDYQAGVQQRIQDQLANQGVSWASVTAQGWVRPAAGYISAYYGYSKLIGFHHGIDFANPCGAPIIAAHSGTVVFAGWDGELGYYMKIDNGGGVMTGYGHQAAGGFKVSVGQQVATGQRVGTVGETGFATGCHLHFDVYANGNRIDPTPFLAAVGIKV